MSSAAVIADITAAASASGKKDKKAKVEKVAMYTANVSFPKGSVDLNTVMQTMTSAVAPGSSFAMEPVLLMTTGHFHYRSKEERDVAVKVGRTLQTSEVLGANGAVVHPAGTMEVSRARTRRQLRAVCSPIHITRLAQGCNRVVEEANSLAHVNDKIQVSKDVKIIVGELQMAILKFLFTALPNNVNADKRKLTLDDVIIATRHVFGHWPQFVTEVNAAFYKLESQIETNSKIRRANKAGKKAAVEAQSEFKSASLVTGLVGNEEVSFAECMVSKIKEISELQRPRCFTSAGSRTNKYLAAALAHFVSRLLESAILLARSADKPANIVTKDHLHRGMYNNKFIRLLLEKHNIYIAGMARPVPECFVTRFLDLERKVNPAGAAKRASEEAEKEHDRIVRRCKLQEARIKRQKQAEHDAMVALLNGSPAAEAAPAATKAKRARTTIAAPKL